jgi:hypothetical protein
MDSHSSALNAPKETAMLKLGKTNIGGNTTMSTISRKHLLRAAGVTLITCATLLTASGLANASVSPTRVEADPACAALELTKIIGGHDHMFVDPTADNSFCVYQIWNDNTGQPAFTTTSPQGDQPAPNGVFDGPGQLLQVVVTDEANGLQAEGPTN